MSDRLHDATGESAGLERALEELRGDVPVRPAWRAELERALSDAAAPATRPAAPQVVGVHRVRWSVHPVTAIAAAIGFIIIGAAGSWELQGRTNGAVSTSGKASAGGAVSTSGALTTSGKVSASGARAATMVQHTGSQPGDIGVRFAVVAPGVASVSLVGDFNGWNPKATPLSLARDGRTWTIMLPLSSGRHTYAFVIDDEIVADPAAPPAIEDDFGKPSSFVVVANNLP